mmetsp:Transcript_61007/g.146879  ORF Transcript_61007/g.146879 Transcript_61007/m.146879 type:complete len:251 (+) Transcript_61007:276-1028(+)
MHATPAVDLANFGYPARPGWPVPFQQLAKRHPSVPASAAQIDGRVLFTHPLVEGLGAEPLLPAIGVEWLLVPRAVRAPEPQQLAVYGGILALDVSHAEPRHVRVELVCDVLALEAVQGVPPGLEAGLALSLETSGDALLFREGCEQRRVPFAPSLERNVRVPVVVATNQVAGQALHFFADRAPVLGWGHGDLLLADDQGRLPNTARNASTILTAISLSMNQAGNFLRRAVRAPHGGAAAVPAGHAAQPLR